MTLEALLQALEAAKLALVAAPEDEALKTAVTEAQVAYDAKKAETESDPDKIDDSKLDEATKNYIAKLRKENGNHRTKSKDLASKLTESEARRKAILKAAGIEDESEKPEEKVKALTAETQNQAFRNAVLESAIEHGIPKDGLKYYQFLIAEATGELKEGEELDDDKLAEIVAEAKKGRTAKSANSTVDGGKGATTKPGASGEITLEKFCSMSITEKSKLYMEKPDLYSTLVAQAKAKKKLV